MDLMVSFFFQIFFLINIRLVRLEEKLCSMMSSIIWITDNGVLNSID